MVSMCHVAHVACVSPVIHRFGGTMRHTRKSVLPQILTGLPRHEFIAHNFVPKPFNHSM